MGLGLGIVLVRLVLRVRLGLGMVPLRLGFRFRVKVRFRYKPTEVRVRARVRVRLSYTESKAGVKVRFRYGSTEVMAEVEVRFRLLIRGTPEASSAANAQGVSSDPERSPGDTDGIRSGDFFESLTTVPGGEFGVPPEQEALPCYRLVGCLPPVVRGPGVVGGLIFFFFFLRDLRVRRAPKGGEDR